MRRRDAGFTLIELGLILLIMSVVLTLIIPRMMDTSHRQLESQARRLAVIFRNLHDEAILNGRVYRLVYDLNRHRYWVESADQSSDFTGFTRESGVLSGGVSLPEPVGFTDVVLPLTAGQLLEGLGATDFYPDGSIELTVVHLDNGEDVYTLWVEPLSGQVHLAAGYQNLEVPR